MIAIIPARGGSKRVPRKNIIDFLGKPLIAWTIEAAVKTGIFKKVFVSTDDEEIAAVAKKYGADVPFFRDKYCDDITPVSKVTMYVLEQLKSRLGEEYETVVQLMPNCPLRNSVDILNAAQAFKSSGASFQISCFKFGWMNPWWAVKLNESNEPAALFPEALKIRSQDLPDLYCPTGAIWVAGTKQLSEQGTFYGKGHKFCPMPWESAVDIDNYDDIDFAKAICNKAAK